MLRKRLCFNAQSSFIPLLVLNVFMVSLLPSIARAGQFGGRSYFDHSPRLVRTTTNNVTSHALATYEFTIAVPPDAGAALQTVKIAQVENLDRVSFNSTHRRAYLDEGVAKGQSVSLAAIGGEQPNDRSETTVTFDPPIQPGQVVTVALDATLNPWHSGIYLFGVTAYPEGDQTSGLFLGFGRVQLLSQ
ncbi:hypothetical protein LEP3755_21360 [Leptolyngbya sp. NIES-3755]|nr:hypothetical protein LEP3755_21360 [Leptolyngbya sp. NIES-3755]